MDLVKSMMISASGLKVQGERMRVISENLANADSLALSPDDDPYRRKVVAFSNVLDRELGVDRVEVKKIVTDKSEFGLRYDPAHPSADENGYIKTPNVNSLIEAMDMRQAQRSYEANLSAIENAKSMLMNTVRLLQS